MVDESYGIWEQNFRVQMKRLREARGETQTDLARSLKALGLPFHQQTVQRVESGERPVRLNEAFIIAEHMQVDLASMTGVSTPTDREIMYAADRLDRAAHIAAGNLEDAGVELTPALEELAATLSALPGTLSAESVAVAKKAIPIARATHEIYLIMESLDGGYGDVDRSIEESFQEVTRVFEDLVATCEAKGNDDGQHPEEA
ncbi:helix-turn-helix domain-containing protein [Propionibacteriaceae bacterium Y1923]|uniref:helix-turn-helix domain-containing protein n=1 Tax=Aestuariimicrobium sp. Y1814 TaxID=3418742 RepID=UPI003C1C8978